MSSAPSGGATGCWTRVMIRYVIPNWLTDYVGPHSGVSRFVCVVASKENLPPYIKHFALDIRRKTQGGMSRWLNMAENY